MVRASSLRAIPRSSPAALHVGNLALERGTKQRERRAREGEERERPERRVPARHHAHFGMWLATACLLLGRPGLYTPVPARVGQETLLVQTLASLSAAQAARSFLKRSQGSRDRGEG